VAGLEITFENGAFVISVDSGDARPVTYRQRVTVPSGDMVSSLFNVEKLFADEEARFLRFGDYRVWMETRPNDDDSVYLDFVDGWHGKSPTVVRKERVCAELLSAARAYRDWVQENDQIDHPCHCLELSVGINDAAQRLRLHREYGSQERYEPTMTTEQLETLARHQCGGEPIQEYMRQTDALKPFVRDLTTRDDDELVSECYENLLGRYEEYARPTAEVLAETLSEQPDERAREGLIIAFWSFEALQLQVLAGLKHIPNEEVIEATADLLGTNARESDAHERCLAAVDLLESVDIDAHLDESADSMVERHLSRAARQAADPELQERLKTVYETL